MTYHEDHPRRSGLPVGRVLIGLVIAAIGLITYFSRTSVNPVTGEKQRIAMSVEQETALGLRAAPEMAQQMGGVLPESDRRARFVEQVGQKIATRSAASKAPYKFDFHLLRDDQTINAFALPGGQVFITLGLYNKLPDEAALAGVLGHEVGHVIGRHSAEHMAKAQLGQSLVIATGVAGSGDERTQNAGALAMVINQMAQLKFSRTDESESDSFGLKFMVEAGYDPRAMLDVMRVLAEASRGNRPPQFLVTHPYPEARLETIEAFLKANPPAGELSRGEKLP